MITGELLLMFQTPHIVPMGDFCDAIESCPGMTIEDQKFLTRAFTQNAVDYSKFWAACTAVEYWVTEQEKPKVDDELQLRQEEPQPAIETVENAVVNVESQSVAQAYCPDIGLKEAILRSQNAVAHAIELQGRWRETMNDMHRRWHGKIKYSAKIV